MKDDRSYPPNPFEGYEDETPVTSTDQFEDADLQDALSCLAPPDGLESSVKKAVRRKNSPRGPFLRIAAIAAVLLLGLGVGIFVPLDIQFGGSEAEAASLQNQIAGYSRNAELVQEELNLVRAADSTVSRDVVASQLALAGLRESADSILVSARKIPAKHRQLDTEQLVQFFSAARKSLDYINTIVEKGQGEVPPEDIRRAYEAFRNIIPPKEIRLTAFEPVMQVHRYEPSDPRRRCSAWR